MAQGRRELAETLHSGDVELEGDEKVVVARFLGLFHLPEPPPAAPYAAA